MLASSITRYFVYMSIRVMWSGALDSSDVLPLYLIVSLESHITIILISTHKHPSTGLAKASQMSPSGQPFRNSVFQRRALRYVFPYYSLVEE